jgi:hypothetical protein
MEASAAAQSIWNGTTIGMNMKKKPGPLTWLASNGEIIPYSISHGTLQIN